MNNSAKYLIHRTRRDASLALANRAIDSEQERFSSKVESNAIDNNYLSLCLRVAIDCFLVAYSEHEKRFNKELAQKTARFLRRIEKYLVVDSLSSEQDTYKLYGVAAFYAIEAGNYSDSITFLQ